jgi:hypothetical protein
MTADHSPNFYRCGNLTFKIDLSQEALVWKLSIKVTNFASGSFGYEIMKMKKLMDKTSTVTAHFVQRMYKISA